MPEYKNEKVFTKTLMSDKYHLTKTCAAKCGVAYQQGWQFCPLCGEAIKIVETEIVEEVVEEAKK